MSTRGEPSRYIIGVNTGPHDATAALLRNGELVAMVEQERLSRRRHALGESPSRAIAACLAHEGIDLGAVTEIAVGWDVPALVESEGIDAFDEDTFTAWLFDGLDTPGGRIPPVRYVEHHLAHAASAFYTSGMSEAAILVVDGKGESVATTVASGGPGGIETIETWPASLSLGLLYACAAEWAGLTIWGTGKLMGLAAYGRANQPPPMLPTTEGYSVADTVPAEGPLSARQVRLRGRLREGFRRRNFPFCPAELDDVMAYADFAASVQHGLEEVLLNLAIIARRETGHSKLVLAGGVAQNCTANGVLIRAGLFDEVWIPPFTYDAGASLGAALFADRAVRPRRSTPPRLRHAFWAPAEDDLAPGAVPEVGRCEMSRHADAELAEVVAGYLGEGKLIGWWQGRAEVGQRALGARSILCDPRERAALAHANRVKGREPWRPLAPAVLAEHVDELFDGPLPAAADFMLAACPVKDPARIPAAVHVDGSARPQVVRPEQSRYHNLIEAFHERTGVPAVINTSFNLAGEPIVLSREDAIRTFLDSGLDVLVLDDVVAVKPTTPAGPSAPSRRQSPNGGGRHLAIPWLPADSSSRVARARG